jgi:hypothetical protein
VDDEPAGVEEPDAEDAEDDEDAVEEDEDSEDPPVDVEAPFVDSLEGEPEAFEPLEPDARESVL